MLFINYASVSLRTFPSNCFSLLVQMRVARSYAWATITLSRYFSVILCNFLTRFGLIRALLKLFHRGCENGGGFASMRTLFPNYFSILQFIILIFRLPFVSYLWFLANFPRSAYLHLSSWIIRTLNQQPRPANFHTGIWFFRGLRWYQSISY